MENKSILEPLKEYNLLYKEQIKENAKKFFDDLTSKANIKVEENKETVKKYNEALSNSDKTNKEINGKKGLKVFLIILFIGFIIGVAVCIYNLYNCISNDTKTTLKLVLNPILIVVFIALAVLSLIYVIKKLNPLITELKEKKDKIDDEADKLLKEAYAQMKALNDSFDYNMIKKVVMNTTPLIQIDDYFDIKKYYFLKEKYGYEEDKSKNTSICGCLSGSLVGNPFLYVRTFNMEMIMKQYVGTRVITTTKRNSKGNTYTSSETLTAYYSAPAPTYFYNTRLIYSSEAAPDLSFSREPSGAKGLDEKGIKRLIKSKLKELKAVEEDSIKNDEHSNIFTPLSNQEFDALFGAYDRNNEVQFRLLFTPLAQNNLEDLILSQEPYGDEYYFTKDRYINYIVTEHMKYFDMDDAPLPYISYSYEISKNTFITNCFNFFQDLYFDLIPLLSIPLYQQYKTQEYIYEHPFKSNFTVHETETLANAFDNNPFSHPLTTTRTILKSTLMEKGEDDDKVMITAYSFQGVDRVIYIPVRASNGICYDVPVHWVEYLPLKNKTGMDVKNCKQSRQEFNNTNSNLNSNVQESNTYHFERGLLATILGSVDFEDSDDNKDDNNNNDNDDKFNKFDNFIDNDFDSDDDFGDND